MNIYLLQNFESIDTQPSLGGRYAYPIPYFDNGPATDGLHIGGACHEQGGSHDPSGPCQVQYRRGGCHLRIWMCMNDPACLSGRPSFFQE